MDLKGFRVHQVPRGTTIKDLCRYFENAENGGTEIEDIHYPLLDNDAIVIFTNDEYKRAFDKDHKINGKKLVLSKLPVKLYSNTTVYLEQAITQLLDENPPLMKNLEDGSDVEILFDAKSMTYKICGDPFQIELATTFLTDAWENQKENGMNAAKSTNGVEVKNDKEEESDSPVTMKSEDAESVNDEVACPHSQVLFKRKDDGREKEPVMTSSPSSNASKKTKRSVVPDDFKNRIPNARMSHKPHLKSFKPEIIQKTDSPLRMSDCRYGDTRAFRPHLDDQRKRRPEKMPDTPRPMQPNLSDLDADKFKFLFTNRPNPVRQSKDVFNQSLTKSEQGETRKMFKNYDSDSEEDNVIVSKEPKECLSRKTEKVHAPPLPPNLMDPHSRVNRPIQPGMSLSQADFPDLALEYESPLGSLMVKLTKGDILTQKTDAIISPAITDLSTSYGVSSVIARNADSKMKMECADYIAKNGNLLFGDVIHTCAGGNLSPSVTYILHAAVPSWREENPEQSAHLLTCTYLNCFQYAEKIWLNSLSMPLIGAGYFGAPLDVCIQSFYDALRLFATVQEEKASKHLKEILLVSNDQDSACSSVVVFRSLMDLDEEQACRAAIERYTKGSEKYDFSAREFNLKNHVPNGGQHPEINQNGENGKSKTKSKHLSNEKMSSNSEKSQTKECCAYSTERGDIYQPRSFSPKLYKDSQENWNRSNVERTRKWWQKDDINSSNRVKCESRRKNEFVCDDVDWKSKDTHAPHWTEFKNSSVVERILKSYDDNKQDSALHSVSSSDEDDVL